MSLETARKVRPVFEGRVAWLNVMGGEITLLPDYPDLLRVLHFVPLRVVTNGWWVDNEGAREKLLSTVRALSAQGPPVHIGVSRDRYHPAGVGDRAIAWLREQNPDLKEDWGFTATKDLEEENRAIAPVGRAWWNELGDEMLRMFSAYCSAHRHNRSMTVLEDGTVTFCNFGAWPMGSLDHGFDALEERRVRMSKVFIPNCVSCWLSWQEHKNESRVPK